MPGRTEKTPRGEGTTRQPQMGAKLKEKEEIVPSRKEKRRLFAKEKNQDGKPLAR